MAIETHNTKRIAKNTIILYVRMIIVMLIALYTSRVVLQALGIEDYGLYNVVGGVVGLFSFLRSSMEKATQRFLNVEMARPGGRPNDIFCVNLTIHILIVVAILLLSETIGLWFLNTYINIPEGREIAANWVYQSVIVSLCLTVLTVPYGACVIAHERMTFYAIVSVLDAVLKLTIAILIALGSSDRLILYGLLMMGISIVNIFFYFIYCRRHFSETRFHFLYDKAMYKSVLSFISWTLLGQCAILGTNQGNNILINMYHGVVANAAMSIGGQVNSAVANLSSNFQTAFNPQITKSYAAGDYSYLRSLIYSTSKISFFLLFIVSLPIMLNIDFILKVWLGQVPQNANIFCILCLCNGIINALSAPLNYSVMASGKIKWFQIITSIVYLSDLVIVYFLFEMGFPPATAMAVKVGIMIIVMYVRLYFSHKEVKALDISSYTRHVLLPLMACIIVCMALTYIVLLLSSNEIERLYLTIPVVPLFVCAIYMLGLENKERLMVKQSIVGLKRKLIK